MNFYRTLVFNSIYMLLPEPARIDLFPFLVLVCSEAVRESQFEFPV